MPRKSKIKDMEQLEADYRAGFPSIFQVAKKHGISHTYLGTLAKREGWERDLTNQVEQRIKQKLQRSAAKVRGPEQYTPEREEEIIEAAADHVVSVAVQQQKDVGKLIGVTMQATEDVENSMASDEDKAGVVAKINGLTASYSRMFGPQRLAHGLDKLGAEQAPDDLGALSDAELGEFMRKCVKNL